MPNQLDCMGECNEHRIPLQEFEQTFCIRCIQPECARSLYGKQRFDKRVATWHERLFSQVPQMDVQDPRFQLIHQQGFLDIDVGPTPEVRSNPDWSTPNQEPVPQATSTLAETPTEEEGVSSPVVEEAKEVSKVPLTLPKHLLTMNTPNKEGYRLNQPDTKGPEPKADCWEAPTSETVSKTTVVRPGAKVRLGGSGVSGDQS